MDRPTSFDVDHTKLKAGIYVSRDDFIASANGTLEVVTFDLRYVSREDLSFKEGLHVVPRWFFGDFYDFVCGLHSLEHALATVVRSKLDEYSHGLFTPVYIGNGGCLTMSYIVVSNNAVNDNPYFDHQQLTEFGAFLFRDLLVATLEQLKYRGVPSAGEKECGSPTLHNKDAAIRILEWFLKTEWNYLYPGVKA